MSEKTAAFWTIGLWLGLMPVAAFCEVVRAKVAARRAGSEFTMYNVMPWFVLWPAMLVYVVVRLPLIWLSNTAVDAAEAVAERITGQEESKDALLRAANKPSV